MRMFVFLPAPLPEGTSKCTIRSEGVESDIRTDSKMKTSCPAEPSFKRTFSEGALCSSDNEKSEEEGRKDGSLGKTTKGKTRLWLRLDCSLWSPFPHWMRTRIQFGGWGERRKHRAHNLHAQTMNRNRSINIRTFCLNFQSFNTLVRQGGRGEKLDMNQICLRLDCFLWSPFPHWMRTRIQFGGWGERRKQWAHNLHTLTTNMNRSINIKMFHLNFLSFNK